MRSQDWPIELYQELLAETQKAGYFQRRHGFYGILAIMIMLGYGVSIYILFTVDNLWLQLLNAVFLAFLGVQLGMLGHDLSHSQVFASRSLNKICAKLAWGLGIGLSESKWYDTHNTHHKEVNHAEVDPDLAMPFIFGPEQVEHKQAYYQRLRRYQHLLFFLILPLVYPIYIIRSFSYNLFKIDAEAVFELLLMVTYYIFFVWLVFSNLPLFVGLVFVLVYSVVAGLYMGIVFAPNHKGMEMVPFDQEVKWFHQIICTRNLYSNPFLFHVTGGLNYQIEHHLFTSMPRINYPKAAQLVKRFCKKHGLPYHETSWVGSMREIYDALNQAQRELLSH